MNHPTRELEPPTDEFAGRTESRPAEPPIELASAEPKLFGAVPPLFALVMGLAAVAVGAVLAISGSLLAGVLFLVAGAVLIALAVDASRRWPASTLPRVTVAALDWLGRHLGIARVSAGAWAEASRQVVALRRELRSLRGERQTRIASLGEAAYREDAEQVAALRSRIAEVDERIAACEREVEAVMNAARERVQRERVAAQPTESFAVPEVPPPLPDDAETRTAPTARRSRTSAGRA